MTTATFAPGTTPPGGAGARAVHHSPHPVGNALRAIKVFAEAVFSVAVLGEYAEEAGVRRR